MPSHVFPADPAQLAVEGLLTRGAALPRHRVKPVNTAAISQTCARKLVQRRLSTQRVTPVRRDRTPLYSQNLMPGYVDENATSWRFSMRHELRGCAARYSGQSLRLRGQHPEHSSGQGSDAGLPAAPEVVRRPSGVDNILEFKGTLPSGTVHTVTPRQMEQC